MSIVTERELHCDVLVAGGGPAGAACALAAARNGAKVILCQDRSVLGGNASSEVRMHIVGATGLRDGLPLQVEAREGGIVEEVRLDLAVQNPQRSASMLDLVLYDKCRREPNLTLLLNTAVLAAEVVDGAIRRVTADRVSTEDRFHIEAKIFVDCTGDGRLGVEAGAPFRIGREGADEFNEALAPAQGDRKTLGSSIMFQARKHSCAMPFQAPPWARKFRAGDFKFRPFGKPGSDLGLEYGYWWLEWGGCLDTIKDNEHIRDELLAIVLGVWDFVKNESSLDVSHWALEWFGFLPGKRESRRFIGQHMLSESDLFQSRAFPDAIAYGGWPIDTHPPEGVDAPGEPPCKQNHLPYFYDIPLRACISTGPRNLMFAGRNFSATHLAFASTRVMATCAAVGQGVGTAAALALRAGVVPQAIAGDHLLITAIQQQLLRDDCYLIGVKNQDPRDQARSATVTASSAQPAGMPENIVSGQTRAVHDAITPEQAAAARPPTPGRPVADRNLWTAVLAKMEAGAQPDELTKAPPDRCFPGTHRWMSDPAQGLPAWIELRWDKPVMVREIVLVFDTGQHRHLTLSQADGYTGRMLWGQPQPETVRDYTLALEHAGRWQEVAREQRNYQRRRVHVIAQPATAGALRLVITATNGLNHARVMEVRVYA